MVACFRHVSRSVECSASALARRAFTCSANAGDEDEGGDGAGGENGVGDGEGEEGDAEGEEGDGGGASEGDDGGPVDGDEGEEGGEDEDEEDDEPEPPAKEEKRKPEPYEVPKSGHFYLHDDRTEVKEKGEGEEEEPQRPKKKLWSDEPRWKHDKYVEVSSMLTRQRTLTASFLLG
jgi:hypothetical protein